MTGLERTVSVDETKLTVEIPRGPSETEEFDTHAHACRRALVIAEALTWQGTPFRNCGDVKGLSGCVDCAMSLTRWHVDTGVLEPFDPRPYPPQWHLHKDEERFLGWVQDKLGGREVPKPRIGDVVLFQFGRCFSHGALYIGNGEIIHAYFDTKLCHISRLDETNLAFLRSGKPRPVKFFEVGPA